MHASGHLHPDFVTSAKMATLMGIGGAAGKYIGDRVEPTSLPQTVAAFHSLVGVAASAVSDKYAFDHRNHEFNDDTGESSVADDAIVVCGYGEVGKAVIDKLGELKDGDTGRPPSLVAFDTSPMLMSSILMPSPSAAVMFGDSSNPEVIMAHGVEKPRALFVSYDE